MNRNVLKFIALISMLIDHIGWQIFPDAIWLRAIGRIAFPIFAFFIAQGLRYTSNRKMYVFNMAIVALVSQIPYFLLTQRFALNILFTFLMAILIIHLIENYNRLQIVSIIFGILIFAALIILEPFNIIDYGTLGVVLVCVFYFLKDKKLYLPIGAVVLLSLTLKNCLFGGFTLINLIGFCNLISILLLMFYNGHKGNKNLKYLFYVFYPVHLLIIFIITLFL